MKTDIKYKTSFLILLFISMVNFLEADSSVRSNSGAWQATSVKSAMQIIFGGDKAIKSTLIHIKAPSLAENGGSVPVKIKTTIPARRVAIFQDANPRALVAVWDVPYGGIVNYVLRIKMKHTGLITVVVEGLDGLLYISQAKVEVSIGGCGGGGGSSYSTSSYTPPRTVVRPSSSSYYAAPRSVLLSKDRDDIGRYDFKNENEFKETDISALSTFSIDVDTASYSNIRNYILRNSQLPPKDKVRTEEMINYFSYDYKQALDEKPFYINTRVGKSIWNRNSKIIQIGLQSKIFDMSELPASNLVFLLDVSGSMARKNKLPLLVNSLKLLVKKLRSIDRVSIVVYAGSSGLVLDRARGDEKDRIFAALDSLRSGGSTAGGAGIQLAYDIAERAYVRNGNNRIILASDGDFNVGVRSERDLVRLIEEKREKGIFLSVLGFGEGNYQDRKMELLANKGDGNYYFIDTLLEAKKVLVTQMSGTLYTVAKDVKIQVEFNPAKVHSYRLIGYENRILANEDFNNDRKDAGEIGLGHRVTALYEIILKSSYSGSRKIDALKYQTSRYSNSNDLLTLKIRYKKPYGSRSTLMTKVIRETDKDISLNDFKFAQSVAGFGMLLTDSKYKNYLTYEKLINTAKDSKGIDRNGYRAEFIKMLEKAELIKNTKNRY